MPHPYETRSEIEVLYILIYHMTFFNKNIKITNRGSVEAAPPHPRFNNPPLFSFPV